MGKINDVRLTPLKQIYNPKGNVFHAMKKSDEGFISFGEAYFSTINSGDIKGWKKHTLMTMNLIVPVGIIEFMIFDIREGSPTYRELYSVTLSRENYCRLTIPPGLWVAFKGIGHNINLLLNIASHEHDPEEAENRELTDPIFSDVII